MGFLAEWGEIERRPEYWRLSPEERASAKAEWFKDRVVPTEAFQSNSEDDQIKILNAFMNRESQPVAEYERDFAGDIVSRAARGGMGLIEGVSGAMRMSDLDPTEEKGLIARAGEKISDFAESAPHRYDILKPDISEATGQEGLLKRGAGGAVESVIPSLAPLAGAYGGAKAGGLLGTAMGGPVGGLIGAGIGGATGGIGTLFATFGLGEYQNTYDRTIKELVSKGLTPEEADVRARKNALVSATAEAGGEFVGDIAAMTFFGAIGGQAAKQPLKQTIKQLIGPKAFGKAVAKAAPFEVGSEMGTAYFQAKAAQEAGVSTMEPGEAVAESVLPSVFMSLMFGGAIHGMNAMEARGVYNDLNSMDAGKRQRAADTIASKINDPESRTVWQRTFNQYLESGKDIPLSQPLADFAYQKTDREKSGQEGVDNISSAQTVDEAIDAFNKSVSPDVAGDPLFQARDRNQGLISQIWEGLPAEERPPEPEPFAFPQQTAEEQAAMEADIQAQRRQAAQGRYGLIQGAQVPGREVDTEKQRRELARGKVGYPTQERPTGVEFPDSAPPPDRVPEGMTPTGTWTHDPIGDFWKGVAAQRGIAEPEKAEPEPDRSDYWARMRRKYGLETAKRMQNPDMSDEEFEAWRRKAQAADYSDVDTAAHEAATSPTNDLPEPTEAQQKAGNYKKGHITVNGLEIAVENPKGSVRKGTDEDGKAWETTMQAHYGYFNRTEGKDGDQVDVFVGPEENDRVFIVDQVNPKTGAFDEHKVVMGAKDEQAARELYLSNYEDGWQGLGAITEMGMRPFKKWLKKGKQTKALGILPDNEGHLTKGEKPSPKGDDHGGIVVDRPTTKRDLLPTSDLPTNVRKDAEISISGGRGFSVDNVAWRRTDMPMAEALEVAPDEDVESEYPFDDLVENIRKNGIQQPIVVGPNGVEGLHRIWAANRAGLKTVPAYVYEVVDTPPTKRQKAQRDYTDWLESLSEADRDLIADEIKDEPKAPASYLYKLKKELEKRKKADKDKRFEPKPKKDKSKKPSDAKDLTDSQILWIAHGMGTYTDHGKIPESLRDEIVETVQAFIDDDAPLLWDQFPGAKEALPQDMSFDEFKSAYLDAFKQSNKYTIDQAGSGYWMDRMAELNDAHPDWVERIEAEAEEEAYGRPDITDFGTIKSPNIPNMAEQFARNMEAGVIPKNKVDVQKTVAKWLGISRSELINDPDYSHKPIEEAFEYAVVKRARQIVKEYRGRENIFRRLEALYNAMPNLSTRTSTSMQNQAYSTPVHLAYLMQEYAGVDKKSWVYEPTAGAGMLIFEADPSQTWANEINDTRLEILIDQGFLTSTKDGAEAVAPKQGSPRPKAYDAVLANPPFGSIQKKTIDGYNISKLEHAIAIDGLKGMKDNGKAAIIIGGEHVGNNGAPNMNQQVFNNYLYSHYNVDGIVEIPGEQYSKQGAKFPVRLILINGRKANPQKSDTAPLPYGDAIGDYYKGKPLPFYSRVNTINQVKDLIKEVGHETTLDSGTTEEVSTGPESPGSDVTGRPGRRTVQNPPSGKGNRPDQESQEPGTDTNLPEPAPGSTERPEGPGDRLPGSGRPGTGMAPAGPSTDNVVEEQNQPEGSNADVEPGQRGSDAGPRIQEGTVRTDTGGVSGTGNVDQDIADLLDFSAAEAEKAKQREDGTAKIKAGKDKIAAGIKKFNDILGETGQIGDNPEADPRFKELSSALKEIWDGLKLVHEGIKEAAQAFIKDVYKQLSSKGKPFIDHFIKTEIRKDLEAESAKKSEPKKEKAPKQPAEDEETEYQTIYNPKSNGKIIDTTLMPRKMKESVSAALDKVEEQYGDIDKFVADKLKYKDTDSLYKALSADQIDAVALAINNIENGSGMVIGDQTGVGKGRVAAAIWKYARLNDHKPVFFTAKPQLFSDYYRDIKDIGFDFYPMIVASNMKDATIVDADGNKVQKPLASTKRRSMYQDMAESAQRGLGEFDGALATYSQVNQPRIQQTALGPLFPGNIIILDEAHKAAGPDSETGRFIRGSLENSSGVVYLSATFAKRPDTMPLYYKTDMSRANLSMEELIAAVEHGDTPLQEILSSDLAKVGQYVRREKSFKGISVQTLSDTPNRARDEERSDAMTSITRDIVALDRGIADAASRALRGSRRRGTQDVFGVDIPGAMQIEGNRLSSTVNRSNFAATVHNAIRQLLLSMKTDMVVDETIKALEERSKIEKQEDGKYRIVDQNGNVIDRDLDKDTAEMNVAENGRKVFIALDNTMGSFIEHLLEDGTIGVGDEFNVSFSAILKRSLERTLQMTVTGPTGEKETHTIDPAMLPPDLQDRYYKAIEDIDRETTGLPGSPIDTILEKLTRAGYRVGEITGRDYVADLSDLNRVTLRKRPKEEKDSKKEILKKFNDGKLDVIIVNRSAAEGVSAHASPSTGKDLRPRMFIGAQAQLNVDDEVQLMGRINRKGQVMLPKYKTLFLDIPAELRPAAVLMRKMKSLSATTSANSDSPLSQKTLPDMDNKYGNRVVRHWLAEHPQIRQDLRLSAEDGFMKASGKISIMPVKVQRDFFEEVELEYRLLVEEMKEQGLYDLEVQDLDYKAVEKEKEIINQGRDETNPFGESTYREKLSVVSPRKPFKRARVETIVEEKLNGRTAEEVRDDFLGKLSAEVETYVQEKTDEAEAAGRSFDASQALGALDFARRTIRRSEIGHTYRLQVEGLQTMTGVFLGYKRAKGRGNPAAGSRIRLEFAVNNSLQKLNLSISKIERGDAFGLAERGIIDNWDEISQSNMRQEVFMITGNLLQGFANVPAGSKIVRFTMKDGTMREGIHLPLSYNPAEQNDRVQVTPEQAFQILQAGNPLTGTNVTVTTGNEILVPRSRQLGGRFFLDETLRGMVEGGEFETRGQHMRARIRDGQARQVVERIYELGDSFSVDRSVFEGSNAQTAEDVMGLLSNETGSSQLATDIYNFANDLVQKGIKNFRQFRARMFNKFKKVWNKIKPHLRTMWDVLNNEGGFVNIRHGEDPGNRHSFEETLQPVTEDDYLENRQAKKNFKLTAETAFARTTAEIKEGLDKFTGSISTRLGNVSQKIKAKVRRLDYDVSQKSNADIQAVLPLLKKARKSMTKEEYADWDYARKNSDTDKLNELIDKYNLRKEYDKYREVLDRIRAAAIDVGLEIGKIDEYAPRLLKDPRGFLTAIGKDPEWPIYTRKLREKAKEMEISVDDMTVDQKAAIISQMILGGYSGLGGLPATKQRKLKKIPAYLNRYYMDSDAALMRHIYSMHKGIEARKFFGKIPKKVAEIRKRLHAVQSKMRQLSKEMKNLDGDEKAKLKKRWNKLFGKEKEYTAYLEKYAMQRDFRENIGAYILEMIEKGEIKPDQERIVNEILNARFHEKGAHGVIQAYKNLSYIDTMGSPISALTQIGDLAWSAYEGGLVNTLRGVYKSVAKKSRITKEDVGIDRIAQEYEDAGNLGRAVSFVFKWVGLEKIDAIGKEALLNTAYEKYRKRAKNDRAKLESEIRPVFESETDEVIQDLLDDQITDNVKLLVYTRLLDFQPVALSEMPQKYLSAGNGRIFYMLKTFTLKQFDIYRNEVYNKLRHGTRAEKIQAIKNLARLTMFFVIANAGADELKDFVLGRKTDFEDRAVDNMLRLFGVSKFYTWKARTEGVGTATLRMILPPVKFIDAAAKDITHAGDGKGLEILGSVPFAGKLAYWHIGKGVEKRDELWDTRLRREKRRLNKIRQEMEESVNPSEFRRQHRNELMRLDRANAMQYRLNEYRRRINKLKKEGDEQDQIERLKEKRIDMIKRFLQKKKTYSMS